MQLGLKTNLDRSGKRRTGTLQPERHPYKTVRTAWGDERGLLFFFLHHEDRGMTVGHTRQWSIQFGRCVAEGKDPLYMLY